MIETTDAIIRKIQALLEKAAATEFEAEAEVFYAKAQELMTQHAVEEWELAKAQPGRVSAKPVQRIVTWTTSDANRPGKKELLRAAVKLAECQLVFLPRAGRRGGPEQCSIIGYEADTQFAELLYASFTLQARRFAPPEFRKGALWTDFLTGFGQRLNRRALERQEAQKTSEPGVALALVDREKDVKDAVHEFFPRLGRSKAIIRKENIHAQNAGRAAADRADISAGRNNLRNIKSLGGVS